MECFRGEHSLALTSGIGDPCDSSAGTSVLKSPGYQFLESGDLLPAADPLRLGRGREAKYQSEYVVAL